MKNLNYYNIENNIKNHKSVFAHKKGNTWETLLEHSEKCKLVFDKVNDNTQILDKIEKAFRKTSFKSKRGDLKFSDSTIDLLLEMFVNAYYMHDIGKINPGFQILKLENKNIQFSKNDFNYNMNSDHSFLSALIYINYFRQRIKTISNPVENGFALYILYNFAYVIKNHHSYLKNFQNYLCPNGTSLESTLQNDILQLRNFSYTALLDNFSMQEENTNFNWLLNNIDAYLMFIINKILYSVIITCDHYATYSFMSNIDINSEFKINYIENPKELIDCYRETNIYKGIQEYKKDKDYFTSVPINALRSDIMIETEDNILKNIDNMFYNLNAPTGSGKTYNSVNAALQLIDKADMKRLFYIFPFNTLIEQTKSVFENEIFKGNIFKDYVSVINSVTPIIDDNIDYQQTLLDREMVNYPMILTSHVNLFNILFGVGKKSSLPILQLCNSVIVLDEIQSYRNSIWKEIIEFLYKYAAILNIKVIIMSATLPNLEELINFDINTRFANLILNPDKYNQNNLFKKRIETIDYTTLSGTITLHKLYEEVDKQLKLSPNNSLGHKTKVLIEFIKKDTARDFYKMITEKYKDRSDIIIFELTGYDKPFYRNLIINKIKQTTNKTIILVATQVIEAGVDIDMDLGFKDSSMVDSEEQFLGRINRSAKKIGCKVFFFNMDSVFNIYRDDHRNSFNKYDPNYWSYVESKNFSEYYKKVNLKIDFTKQLPNGNGIGEFYKNLSELSYTEISKHMELITMENVQVFLPHIIKDENGAVVVENGVELNGEVIWKKFIELNNNNTMRYAEKKIKSINYFVLLSYFTYQMPKEKLLDKLQSYENIGDIYYIPNGNKYIDNGKFDATSFKLDFQ